MWSRENEMYRKRTIQNTIQLKGKQKIILVEKYQLQRYEKDCLIKSERIMTACTLDIPSKVRK